MKIFMMMITNMYTYMSLFVAVTLLLSLYRWPISISIIYCVYMIVCILNVPLLNSVFCVYMHNSEASLFLLYFL